MTALEWWTVAVMVTSMVVFLIGLLAGDSIAALIVVMVLIMVVAVAVGNWLDKIGKDH